ncbi:FtsK/SpoIIIE domain-containing protein [Streptomyces californicus]|uniref:FtsK/SpoIIIE domain-containing protein n=1 Tax=Streptomyces californicus TaxID=67351 RepID=UPI0033D47EE7
MSWTLIVWLASALLCLGLLTQSKWDPWLSERVARSESQPWWWTLIGYPTAVVRVRLTWGRVCRVLDLDVPRRAPRALLDRDTMITGTVLKGLPPRLGFPRITSRGLRVTVRLHPGQTPAAFIACADAFAHAWRVYQVRVTSPRRGVVELIAIARDPLTGDRSWPMPPAPRLLTATLGRTDEDAVWTVDLRKIPHWLITGATQSGKSTLLASWLTELGSQPVILVGIDLKGGMELGLYERRLSALATNRADAIRLLTSVLSEVMDRMGVCRLAGVRSIWDLHDDIRPDPVVIVVDEVAELLLVASLNGRKDATECATLLLRIAQLGAALGVHLIISAQRFGSDLGPGATAIRAQVGGRVCHRVNDEQTAVMSLGDLAPDAVAVAQTITEDEKGVAVSAVDGHWRRVRSRYVTPSALRTHAELTDYPLRDAFLTPPREGGVSHE